MACIGTIAASLALACGTPAIADLNKIVGAKFLNADDIASYTVAEGSVATITKKPTTRAWDLTAINDAVVITVGIKSQDVIPGAYDVSVTFKSFTHNYSAVSSASPLGAIGTIPRAQLVFAVDHGNGEYKVYGLGAPLVCIEMTGDSSASAYITYTFGVEDWQVGTTIHRISKADYDALSTPQPAPKP